MIATAQVFFKRFYLQYSFISFDPRLAAPTMLFVAAKVEECPINAKILLGKLNRMEPTSLPQTTHAQTAMPSPALVNQSHPQAAGALAASIAAHKAACSVATTPAGQSAPPPTVPPYMYDMEDLLEMEFAILVGLKYDLIVYHPYRPMMQYLSDMKMNECLQMAQDIVNDTYRLDLPLLHPPYVLAIASIYMACNFLELDYRPWFKTLNVSQDTIIEITRELLLLWDDNADYVAPTNQAHILALLTKLNEKKFLTLAQQRPAAAAAGAASAAAAHPPTLARSPDHMPQIGQGTNHLRTAPALTAVESQAAVQQAAMKRTLEFTAQANIMLKDIAAEQQADPKRPKY